MARLNSQRSYNQTPATNRFARMFRSSNRNSLSLSPRSDEEREGSSPGRLGKGFAKVGLFPSERLSLSASELGQETAGSSTAKQKQHLSGVSAPHSLDTSVDAAATTHTEVPEQTSTIEQSESQDGAASRSLPASEEAHGRHVEEQITAIYLGDSAATTDDRQDRKSSASESIPSSNNTHEAPAETTSDVVYQMLAVILADLLRHFETPPAALRVGPIYMTHPTTVKYVFHASALLDLTAIVYMVLRGPKTFLLFLWRIGVLTIVYNLLLQRLGWKGNSTPDAFLAPMYYACVSIRTNWRCVPLICGYVWRQAEGEVLENFWAGYWGM